MNFKKFFKIFGLKQLDQFLLLHFCQQFGHWFLLLEGFINRFHFEFVISNNFFNCLIPFSFLFLFLFLGFTRIFKISFGCNWIWECLSNHLLPINHSNKSNFDFFFFFQKIERSSHWRIISRSIIESSIVFFFFLI